MSSNLDVQSNGTHVFWGEIAPWEHIAQFYEHDGVLLDSLVGFIGGGLRQRVISRPRAQIESSHLNDESVGTAYACDLVAV